MLQYLRPIGRKTDEYSYRNCRRNRLRQNDDSKKNYIKLFKNEATILSHDFYYKAHEEMPFEERIKLNYDHPDSLDTDMLVQHVKQLKEGVSIKHPTYDFVSHSRQEWQQMDPSKILIVEGILIFTNKRALRFVRRQTVCGYRRRRKIYTQT